MRILKNRELKNMVMVDNCMTSFANQLDNGIHIQTYLGQKDDHNLLKVLKLLKEIAFCENIPEELRRKLGLSELLGNYRQSRP